MYIVTLVTLGKKRPSRATSDTQLGNSVEFFVEKYLNGTDLAVSFK